MSKSEVKDEEVAADTGTDNDTAEQSNETAADTGSDTAGASAPFNSFPGNTPEQEERYTRQRALELACYGGGNIEAKEPILAVLARAEAYRLYIESGETGIVA